MRNLIIVCFFLCLTSCNQKVLNEPPLGYSFIPGYLNIDSIQPFFLDDTNRVVDSTYVDFPSIPLDGGKFIGNDFDTISIPEGILISDRKAVLYMFYKASWERQQKELYYSKYLMREFYDKAKAAEVLYQNEIRKLENKAERSWLEKNMGYFGFLAGVATVIITSYALFGGSNFAR